MKQQFTVLCILSCLFIAGCNGSKWSRTPLIEDGNFNVILERSHAKGQTVQQEYGHPYDIPVAKLEKLLGDLTYREELEFLGSEKEERVFQKAEIQRLAKALSETLVKANADQRIRFVSFNLGETLLFSKRRKTEGVIFINAPNRLNIAFSSINRKADKSVSTGYASGSPDAEPSYPDPLDVRTAVTPLVQIPSYAEKCLLDGNKPAPMWIVVDLGKLDQTLLEADIQNETAAEPDLRQEMGKVPEAKDSEILPAEPGASEMNHGEILQQKIKKQLRYLKELLDEGLITEADYEAKKSELLKKIR